MVTIVHEVCLLFGDAITVVHSVDEELV